MTTRWLYNNLLTLQTNLCTLHWNKGVSTLIEHKKITKNFCWLYEYPLTLQQPADFGKQSEQLIVTAAFGLHLASLPQDRFYYNFQHYGQLQQF